MERRAAARRRRRRRRIAATAIAGLAVAACVVVFVALPAIGGGGADPLPDGDRGTSGDDPAAVASPPSPSRAEVTVTPSASPSPSPSASPSSTVSAASSADSSAGKPAVVATPIPFGDARRAEMADYSQRHYGEHTVALTPKVILLHYTAGGTAESVWAYFSRDVADGEYGELPGPVAHFIVDQDGTIYQLLPTDTRGRHVVGLNHRAIGIEFVQDAGSTPDWGDRQILARRKQCDAGLALVRYLMTKYGIAKKDVIGHAMANDHRLFVDLQGWHNTHGDWSAESVREFRRRL